MHHRKVLFIGGSLNQTTMMYQVSRFLTEFDCYFTPLYCDGFLKVLSKTGMLNFTPLGGKHKEQTELFLKEKKVKTDYEGLSHNYDLVVISSDLVIQKNIRGKRVVLVQEGMTDPENLMYYLVKNLKLPRYLASTSVNGLSDGYDTFCVASEGYKNLFIRKGVRPEKIAVTGIPNFDHFDQHMINTFPYHHYVLVATSDARETLKYDNRKKFITDCVKIAKGRPLIFKLHPNENVGRATREINRYAPGSLIFAEGNTNDMIANCDVLITQYSTVAYNGLALKKEVYSYFDVDMLKQLLPIQNQGNSARNIADICRKYLHDHPAKISVPLENSFFVKSKFKNLVHKISGRAAL
jgi:hypothetical protein